MLDAIPPLLFLSRLNVYEKPIRGLTCMRVGAAPLRTPSADSRAPLGAGADPKPLASTRAPYISEKKRDG